MVLTPCSLAQVTAEAISLITASRSSRPPNLWVIIWSEVDMETFRSLTPVDRASVTSETTARHQPSRIRLPKAPASLSCRLART